MMTPTQAVQTCFRKYANFQGRASRAEFWWFTAFLFAGSQFASMAERMTWRIDGATAETGATYFSLAFSAVTLIPSVASQTRRLQDVGQGVGVMIVLYAVIFFSVTAFVNAPHSTAGQGLIFIVLVIALGRLILWNIQPSQPGKNKFGPNPHEVPQ